MSGLYALKVNGKNLFFAATDLGLLKSEDMAEHWMLMPIPNATAAVTALYFGPGAAPAMIARTAAGLFLSKDCGEHWDAVQFPRPAGEINDLAMPPVEGAPTMVATRSGLFSSTNGEKWTPIAGGLPSSTVNSVIYGTEGMAFAVEYGRLFQSKDNGASWAEIHSALPLTRIRQLWKADATAARIYALTGDLGVLYRD